MSIVKTKEEKTKKYLSKTVGDEEHYIEALHCLLDKNIICNDTNIINSMPDDKQGVKVLDSEANNDKMVHVIKEKDDEIRKLRNKLMTKDKQNKDVREQVKCTLKQLEEKLYERRVELMEYIDQKEREKKRWELAFKLKEKELRDIKSKKTDLIFFPSVDTYQIAKFLL